MTIPMLPGWWDANADSVKSLLNTTARVADPNFDNKLALAEFMRQNPANQQSMIDAASLNPQMVQQMYGQSTLEGLMGMGTPSVAAQLEKKSQQIFNTPVNQLDNTVGTAAAVTKLTGKDAADREEQSTRIAGQKQQTEYYTAENLQKRFLESQENPAIAARSAALQANIRDNPNIRSVNPEKLARDYLSGGLENDETLAGTLDALANVNPPAYEAFQNWVKLLSDAAQDDKRDTRENDRLNRQDAREDNIERRQALAWARQQAASTGMQVQDLFDYAMLEDTPGARVVQSGFVRNEAGEQARSRLRQIGGMSTFINNYRAAANGDNKDARDASAMALNAELSSLFSTPQMPLSVSVDKIDDPDSWWGKKSVFNVNGVMMDGDILNTYMMDPSGLPATVQLVGRMADRNLMPDAELMGQKTMWDNFRPASPAEQVEKRFMLEKINAAISTRGLGRTTPSGRASTRQPTRP